MPLKPTRAQYIRAKKQLEIFKHSQKQTLSEITKDPDSIALKNHKDPIARKIYREYIEINKKRNVVSLLYSNNTHFIQFENAVSKLCSRFVNTTVKNLLGKNRRAIYEENRKNLKLVEVKLKEIASKFPVKKYQNIVFYELKKIFIDQLAFELANTVHSIVKRKLGSKYKKFISLNPKQIQKVSELKLVIQEILKKMNLNSLNKSDISINKTLWFKEWCVQNISLNYGNNRRKKINLDDVILKLSRYFDKLVYGLEKPNMVNFDNRITQGITRSDVILLNYFSESTVIHELIHHYLKGNKLIDNHSEIMTSFLEEIINYSRTKKFTSFDFIDLEKADVYLNPEITDYDKGKTLGVYFLLESKGDLTKVKSFIDKYFSEIDGYKSAPLDSDIVSENLKKLKNKHNNNNSLLELKKRKIQEMATDRLYEELFGKFR